jgi:uncharacterized membrane protein (DUF485 family)
LAEKDWKQIAESPAFRELIRKKRAFIIPSVVFFFVFYFTLPVLTAYTTVLNGKVIGAINWAYLYAFAQFAMTWILCHLYMNKAAEYDELVAKVKNESVEKGVRTG